MVYFNLQDRNVPKGIQIGKDASSLVLETNEELTKVRHFGMEYELHAVEVRFPRLFGVKSWKNSSVTG